MLLSVFGHLLFILAYSCAHLIVNEGMFLGRDERKRSEGNEEGVGEMELTLGASKRGKDVLLIFSSNKSRLKQEMLRHVRHQTTFLM